ncbi:MAG TPA: redoxin domain-containing protein [Fimbriimonadaceae bacterium]|nr:redoxin domain-containing protein [Fimbriimonadaceae bacterium]
MKTFRVHYVVAAGLVVGGLFAALGLSAPHRQSPAPHPGTEAAPALTGDQWINVPKGGAAKVADFKGRITVLHFWTFECINCKHNLPYYAKWAAQYKPEDVQIIGVHTPELETEKDPANVKDAVKALGITYPVLIDGDGANWKVWRQEVWPTVYVVDKKGQVRYRWTGELEWDGQDGFGQVSAVITKLEKES